MFYGLKRYIILSIYSICAFIDIGSGPTNKFTVVVNNHNNYCYCEKKVLYLFVMVLAIQIKGILAKLITNITLKFCVYKNTVHNIMFLHSLKKKFNLIKQVVISKSVQTSIGRKVSVI